MDNYDKVQIHYLTRDLARVTAERDALAAEVEAMRAVVDAARVVADHAGPDPDRVGLASLRRFLRALDIVPSDALPHGALASSGRLEELAAPRKVASVSVQASGVVRTGLCSIKGPSCTAPVTAAPITVVVEVETKNQIPVCRTCFQGMVSDGEWHPNYSFDLRMEKP